MTAPTDTASLVVRRTINAPPETVFRVWSEPELAARWGWGKAYDTVAIELDCRPGGAWRHQIRDRNTGETFWFDGVFREVTSPHRIVHTFHWTSDRGHDESTSLVEIDLVRRGTQTEVVITHTQLPAKLEAETREGWADCLREIERAVTSADTGT